MIPSVYSPRFSAVSRREFLVSSALGFWQFMKNECPPTYYGSEADAKKALDGMLKQAGETMDPHNNTLPVKWPANTVIYPSNIQQRVSVIEESEVGTMTDRLTKKLAEKATTSLYDGFSHFKKGIVTKSYGQFFPLAPVVPPKEAAMKGWQKSDNGKKQRYVLVISGEGNTPDEIRKHLKLKAKEHPDAAHTTDEKFSDYLMEQEDTNLILGYRNKLREEQWFYNSGQLMCKALKDHFAVPGDDDNVTVIESADAHLDPDVDKNTHMVVLCSPSAKEIEKVMKVWLAPLQKGNAELMVYYNGHGERAKVDFKNRAQGSDEGELYLRGDSLNSTEAVTETQWKKWFNQYLSKFGQVAFVIDACHSGAFYAQAKPAQSRWLA